MTVPGDASAGAAGNTLDSGQEHEEMASQRALPPGLRAQGKRLWGNVANKYLLRPDERRVLEDACRLADAIAALERAMKGQPLTVKGSAGQPVLNPLFAEQRPHRLALGSLLKQINLPDDPCRRCSVQPTSRRRDVSMGTRARQGRCVMSGGNDLLARGRLGAHVDTRRGHHIMAKPSDENIEGFSEGESEVGLIQAALDRLLRKLHDTESALEWERSEMDRLVAVARILARTVQSVHTSQPSLADALSEHPNFANVAITAGEIELVREIDYRFHLNESAPPQNRP